jgi:hypothetical protein
MSWAGVNTKGTELTSKVTEKILGKSFAFASVPFCFAFVTFVLTSKLTGVGVHP